MKMRIGYTADHSEMITKVICHVTGGPASHCFPIFDLEDGEIVYFESISKKDKITGKTGVRGPYNIDNVHDWQRDKPASRTIEVSDYLPFNNAECQNAYKIYLDAVPKIHYAYVQCANNWVERRFRVYCHIGSRGKARWNCSETVVRGMPSRVWKYFQLLDSRADEIVPSGGNLISVRESVKAMLKSERNSA